MSLADFIVIHTVFQSGRTDGGLMTMQSLKLKLCLYGDLPKDTVKAMIVVGKSQSKVRGGLVN